MPDIAYIPDHPDRAVARLLSQYRRQPRIQALVRALTGGAQAVEDVAFDLLASQTLSAASGRELELWGRIVGEARRGLDDTDYRRFIEARILANLSEGDVDRMIRIFDLVTGNCPVRYYTLYPAAFALVMFNECTPLQDRLRRRIRRIMESVKPAGVSLTLIEATGNAYQYDSGPGLGVGEFSRVI